MRRKKFVLIVIVGVEKKKQHRQLFLRIFDGLNPYGGWSVLVIGLMGASWMLAKLIDVRERFGEFRHSHP